MDGQPFNKKPTLRVSIFFASTRKFFEILFATAQNTLSLFLNSYKANPKKNERVFSPSLYLSSLLLQSTYTITIDIILK